MKFSVVNFSLLVSFWISIFSMTACTGHPVSEQDKLKTKDKEPTMEQTTAVATFGGGCFWCTEAVFQDLKGVLKVESGYSGGQVVNPTYKQVCTGTTGHAEVIQVTYDPKQITYLRLLEAFFYSHDPTTLNRQGNDEGTQYRSVVFYRTPEEQAITEEVIKKLNASGAYASKIVTEVSPFKVFYKAEDYHQNYYNDNGNQPYCAYVIKPKLDKFRKAFQKDLK